MSNPSAIPAVIDGLVAKFTAVMPADTVYDGPGVSDAAPNLYVLVGASDPDAENFEEAASSDQAWAWIGHNQRDETITVHCVAVAWTGDDAMSATRTSAFGVVQTVTDAIQTDPSLATNGVLFVEGITSMSLKEFVGARGTCVYVPFDVKVRARLS